MIQFGPLKNTWSMRFESKHLYFKRIFQSTKNSINLLFTFAQRHQQLQSIYNFKSSRIVGKGVEITCCKPLNIKIYNTEIRNILAEFKDYFLLPKVKIMGLIYKPGMCVVVGFRENYPIFANIILILSKSDSVIFLSRVFESTLNFHIRGFILKKCIALKIIRYHEFIYSYPFPIYKYKNDFICIPKYFLCDTSSS